MKLSIENNFISIDNYKQIIYLSNDLIITEEFKIYGNDLYVISLDPIGLIIKGFFIKVELGEYKNAIQNIDEQK